MYNNISCLSFVSNIKLKWLLVSPNVRSLLLPDSGEHLWSPLDILALTEIKYHLKLRPLYSFVVYVDIPLDSEMWEEKM